MRMKLNELIKELEAVREEHGGDTEIHMPIESYTPYTENFNDINFRKTNYGGKKVIMLDL